jgi:hypothetical protein
MMKVHEVEQGGALAGRRYVVGEDDALGREGDAVRVDASAS